MPREPEYVGRKFVIQCVELPHESCPAGDFIDGLDESDRTKLDVIYQYLGDHGRLSNKEKFKKIEGSEGIFEIKIYQIRILCFFVPGRRLMLAFGLRKKQDRLRPADIARAERIRERFFRELEEGGGQ